MDENKYFPELTDVKRGKVENMYGILNLNLQKSDNVLTGYIWRYTYFDGERLRHFSSFDLVKLRHLVESKGYDWIVTDINKARDTYDLNRELMEEYDVLKKERNEDNDPYFNRRASRSGVQYVYLNKRENASYWVYRNHELSRTYTRKTLSDLRDLVMYLGYDWIVKDPDLYNSIIMAES